MDTLRWKRVEELFDGVVELPPAERADFLARECGDDRELRSEVESLLDFDRPSLTHVDEAVADAALSSDERLIGKRVGAYRVTRLIGEGGMGTVFEAVRADDEYQQRVALKIVRRVMETPQTRMRFFTERQILATLEHPSIARMLDGGSYKGSEDGEPIPYLVMEFVDGLAITKYCDQEKLAVEDRLRLFRRVLDAVSYAHQKLIIHRDLKPGNILVATNGKPKLLDFGIAKLADPTLAADRTVTAAHLMTPDYSSPEHVRGEPPATSSDIYSLGLILYELLTGERAQKLEAYSTAEIYEVICTREAPPASAVAPMNLRRALRGDLDAIVSKAIHKDATRRYASVEQLSEDIRRYLEGFPILAHGDSFAYRAAKFTRRHSWPVALTALLIVALAGGVATTSLEAQKAERRFNELREISNQFLFEFHDEVAKLPGSIPAREMVVRTALQYLASLARDSQGNPELQTEVAIAYGKVGNAQGMPGQPNLGRVADAAASYEKSVTILSDLVQRGKGGAHARRSLVFSEVRLGELYQHLNKSSDGRAMVERAVAHAKDLPANNPDNEEAMGMADVAIGDLLLAESKTDEALWRYRQGLEHRRLAAASGLQNGYRQLSVTYERLGWALWRGGDLLASLAAFQGAEKLDTDLYRQSSDSHRLRRKLLLDYQFLGNIYGATTDPSLGDVKTATGYYRRMLDLAKQSHDADPTDVEGRHDLLRAHVKMDEVEAAIDPHSALTHLRAAHAICVGLPDTPLKQVELGVIAVRFADTYREMHDFAQAKQWLDQAARLASQKGPLVLQGTSLEEMLAEMYRIHGEIHLVQGERSAAIHSFEQALPLVEKANAAALTDLSARWGFSRILDALARANAGLPEKAQAYRKRQIDLWQDWNAHHPRSPFSEKQGAEAEGR